MHKVQNGTSNIMSCISLRHIGLKQTTTLVHFKWEERGIKTLKNCVGNIGLYVHRNH